MRFFNSTRTHNEYIISIKNNSSCPVTIQLVISELNHNPSTEIIVKQKIQPGISYEFTNIDLAEFNLEGVNLNQLSVKSLFVYSNEAEGPVVHLNFENNNTGDKVIIDDDLIEENNQPARRII